MPPSTRFAAALLILAGVSLSSIASAKGQFSLGIGAQSLLWEEFVSSSGATLLDETGFRYTASLSYDIYDQQSDGLLYGIDFLGYLGDVDYDGSTQLGVEARTTTSYLGSDLRVTLGYRNHNVWPQYSFDWIGGLGYNSWGREIGDGVDAMGSPFSGYTEIYSVLYAHLGGGLFRRGHTWDQYLQFGFKRPVEITEKVEEPFHVRLEPGANTSFYFNWNFYRKDSAGMRDYAITLYADSFRFSDSSPVLSAVDVTGDGNPDPVFQPKSDYSVLGVRLIWFVK